MQVPGARAGSMDWKKINGKFWTGAGANQLFQGLTGAVNAQAGAGCKAHGERPRSALEGAHCYALGVWDREERAGSVQSPVPATGQREVVLCETTGGCHSLGRVRHLPQDLGGEAHHLGVGEGHGDWRRGVNRKELDSVGAGSRILGFANVKG